MFRRVRFRNYGTPPSVHAQQASCKASIQAPWIKAPSGLEIQNERATSYMKANIHRLFPQRSVRAIGKTPMTVRDY
jgi:hypothetical protein